MKSVFDGYLTPDCANCKFWEDGTADKLGCYYVGPIMNCPSFAKMYEEESNKEEMNVQDCSEQTGHGN